MASTIGVLKDFSKLSRLRDEECKLRDASFENKQRGKRSYKQLSASGRVVYDMMTVVQMNHKLRSYSLNFVSAHFLGHQKDDVSYSRITPMWLNSEEDRETLCRYCLKDAILPEEIMDVLCILPQFVEMLRVCGIPADYLVSRGQQIKVIGQLAPRSHHEGFLIPYVPVEESSGKYTGAIVVQPERGYYPRAITTLDFSSLYPSIMIAHNLCYTTWVRSESEVKRMGVPYHVTPNGDVFVDEDGRKGILPDILNTLLANRTRAKGDLKKANAEYESLQKRIDSGETGLSESYFAAKLKAQVLDGRQLALKISANSVYGFTGATIGKLPLLAIAQSVTAYGRDMIFSTAETIVTTFTAQRLRDEFGLTEATRDAKVIYGDTDSVMIDFDTPDVATAMRLGRLASDIVNKNFKKPICIVFEKVYCPYLLINKKRYAGLYWTKPDKPDFTDAKGIETVRRDNCRAVSDTLKVVLDDLMGGAGIDVAIEKLILVLKTVKTGTVPWEHMIVTKNFAKEDYKSKQPHVEVVKKMKKRCAASAPRLGSRVPYVFVRGVKGDKSSDNAEEPLYALKNGLCLDYELYIERQFFKPVMRIFGPILMQAKKPRAIETKSRTVKESVSLVTDDEVKAREKELAVEYGKLVQTRIFSDPRLRVFCKTTPFKATGGIARFCQVIHSCLLCRQRIPLPGLCKDCTSDTDASEDYLANKMEELALHKKTAAEYKKKCFDCRGGLEAGIEQCSNTECDIFFARYVEQQRVEKLAQLLKNCGLEM